MDISYVIRKGEDHLVGVGALGVVASVAVVRKNRFYVVTSPWRFLSL